MTSIATDEKELFKIARRYYLENQTQEEIARQLGISRTHVSRLLQKCREDGIIQIRLLYPFLRNHDQEQDLRKRFGIRDAVVVIPEQSESALSALGRAGSYYLQTIVGAMDVLGVSWGTTLAQVVHHLGSAHDLRLEVVQLMGGLANAAVGAQPNEQVHSFATAFGGRPCYLSAPLYVESKVVAEALQRGPIVGNTLRKALTVTVALVGIGAIDLATSLFRCTGLPRESVAKLQSMGAVGEICGRFFNRSGQPCAPEFDSCTMSASIEDLSRVPCVIGIAAGNQKTEAIRSALGGELIDVLITDEQTATQVLA